VGASRRTATASCFETVAALAPQHEADVERQGVSLDQGGSGCQAPTRLFVQIGPPHRLAPRTDSSFVIFALERILKYLVDSWVEGIGRMAVIADINRDRNAAMNVAFVAPLPKSDVSLLSADVAFAT
jgi:hypothetical protein